MCQKSLNQRVGKARKAVQAGVLQKVTGGYRVPSRTQVYPAIVLAKFQTKGHEAGYRMTCHYEHKLGQGRCPGNSNGHICWHCIATLLAAAKGPVAFFEDLNEAFRYSHLGGKICTVWSGDGVGKLYAVVGGKK